MSKSLRQFIFPFLVLLFYGCAGTQQAVLAPVPVEDRSVENIDFENRAQGADSSEQEHSATRNKPSQWQQRDQSKLDEPVLTALLEDVDRKISANDDRAAAASLERALRLDAKNPALWHRLARVRLQQKNWQQALNLAKKSNSLAAGDYTLQLENWRLIYRANQAAGEQEAADFASVRIREIESRLP